MSEFDTDAQVSPADGRSMFATFVARIRGGIAGARQGYEDARENRAVEDILEIDDTETDSERRRIRARRFFFFYLD